MASTSESREGIAWSGWPFGLRILDPYYLRAQAVCGLAPFSTAAASPGAMRSIRCWSSGEGGLNNTVYQYGSADRFHHRASCRTDAASSSVLLVHGATVTGLSRSANGERIDAVHWTTASGRRGVARASAIVGAGYRRHRECAHSAPRPGGIGPGSAMASWNTPSTVLLQLISRAPALSPTPGFYEPHTHETSQLVMGRVGLSPELLRREKLRNASLRFVAGDVPEIVSSVRVRQTARRLGSVPGAAKADWQWHQEVFGGHPAVAR